MASVKRSTLAILIEFIIYLVVADTAPPKYIRLGESGEKYVSTSEINEAVAYNQAALDMKYRLPLEIWKIIEVIRAN